jgi:aerobic-type carbon monoxide dehydrogenase small subunit (CoxS/CutS family)
MNKVLEKQPHLFIRNNINQISQVFPTQWAFACSFLILGFIMVFSVFLSDSRALFQTEIVRCWQVIVLSIEDGLCCFSTRCCQYTTWCEAIVSESRWLDTEAHWLCYFPSDIGWGYIC